VQCLDVAGSASAEHLPWLQREADIQRIANKLPRAKPDEEVRSINGPVLASQ